MRVTIWITLAMIGLTCLSGCGDAQKEVYVNQAAIDAMARDLLKNIAEGTPQVPYNQYFSTLFKRSLIPAKEKSNVEKDQETLSRESWEARAEEYRERFGKVVTITLERKDFHSIDDIPEGVVYYKVKWEKTEGMLQMNLTQQAGDWEITYMHISCPDFEKARDDVKNGKSATP